MKTIGIIGGIGPASTIEYYRRLNEGVRCRLGSTHSAKVLLSALDGADVKYFRDNKDDAGEGRFYADEALRIENAGADCLLIASNTSHKNAPYIEAAINIPLLHLAHCTAEKLTAINAQSIALLGTSTLMEQDFYRDTLTNKNLQVVTPDKPDRDWLTALIYDELCQGIIYPGREETFLAILDKLKARGADTAVLACTELTLLDLRQSALPLYDTVDIHVERALAYALNGDRPTA